MSEDRPSYYKPGSPSEPWEIVDGFEHPGAFYAGNVIKYFARLGKKSENKKSDLLKAAAYFEKLANVPDLPSINFDKLLDVSQDWGLLPEEQLLFSLVVQDWSNARDISKPRFAATTAKLREYAHSLA